MELKEINKYTYLNGDSNTEYKYDAINSQEDINEIVDMLVREYGEIDEIICVKKDKDNDKIEFFKEYSSINEFKDDFKIENLGIINLTCKDKYIYFILNNDGKTLTVFDKQNALGEKKYDINKVKYYKDEYDNIIKYDGNNGMFYLLDIKTNEFVARFDISSSFYGDGEYTEIRYNEDIKHR